jgi:hypothetical protein
VTKNEVLCVYLRGELVSMSGTDEHEYERVDYRCEALPESDPLGLGGMAYDLPANLLATLDVDILQSGISRLKLKGATIYWDQATQRRTLDFELGATVEVVVDEDTDARRRLMIRTQGTSNMLMVLVRSADSVNSLQAKTVAERMFSLTGVSVASQYDACSAGKLNFEPATYVNPTTGQTVNTGVGELYIEANVLGSVMTSEFEQQLQVAFPSAFGDFNSFDHVLYCMPAGMNSEWIGYTYGRYVRATYCILRGCSQGA